MRPRRKWICAGGKIDRSFNVEEGRSVHFSRSQNGEGRSCQHGGSEDHDEPSHKGFLTSMKAYMFVCQHPTVEKADLANTVESCTKMEGARR
ncbi:unnamed protein product [Linum trigynum]|uniref:Uncharacterized protein n=1 Tax=Linum trigynum TaxID=586398 RepID=A0AAV2ED96_9ROSI